MHLIFYFDSHARTSIAIGCIDVPTIQEISDQRIHTVPLGQVVCHFIASCQPIQHHSRIQSSPLQTAGNKRISLLFLLVGKITVSVKLNSHTTNNNSLPSIIAARDNAETLDAQDSDCAFSFHRVVDIVQKLVPHCLLLVAR